MNAHRRSPSLERTFFFDHFRRCVDSLRRRAPAVVGVGLLACVPPSGPVAPQVAPSSTLNVAPPDHTSPQAFAVVHVAPVGPTTGDPAPFVVFSRPARPLAPDAPVPPGLTIRPEVPGHWEWVGSQALSYVPQAGRLPRGTAFSVTVPETLQSVQGERLKEGAHFEFQTPLPKVERMSPGSWEHSVTPDTPIVLSLSQPTRPEAIEPYIAVQSTEGGIPISVSAGSEANQVRVSPSEGGWPLDRRIVANVKPGWPGTEGPLGAAERFEGSFRTYGPLTAKVECHRDDTGRCHAGSHLALRLSNPVLGAVLARSIRAPGTTLRVDRSWAPDQTTFVIDLGVSLVPRQKFTVIVDPIKDVYGQPLKWVKNRQIEVLDYPASVKVGFSGDSFLPQQKSIAIHARNTGYELAYAQLDPQRIDQLNRSAHAKRFEFLSRLEGAKTRRVSRGKLNEWDRLPLSLDEIAPHGAFAVGVRYLRNGQETSEVRWGQRTGLGISAKSGRDRAHVWVTELDSGKPVSGATVRTLGSTASARSDARGLATLPGGQLVARTSDRKEPTWLEVRHGQDVAYRSSDETIGSWRLPVATDFWGDERDIALLFPERDLFRPGQSAWVKGYVRRPSKTGTTPIKRQEMHLELVSPTGEVAQSSRVTTNEYGALADRLRIPGSAQLGYFTLRLRRGKEILTTSGIQVAEYRPSEFEVHASSPTASVVSGEEVTWNVEGSYFYGGAMAKAQVETTLHRHQTWFSPPGFESRVSDDQAWQALEDFRPYSVFLESHDAKLSDEGKLDLSSSSKLEHQVGPERLEFEATIHDVSAQTVSARASVLVHPAAYYPVLAPLESRFFDAPGTLRPQVWAVTPEGQALENRSVSLSLHRIRWTHVKHPGSGGSTNTTREPVLDQVATCAVVSSAQGRSCPLQVAHSGQYIVRATATDRSGRSVSSSIEFYAPGDGGYAGWPDLEEKGMVPLSADREVYQVGQTARILIQSPFEKARAWITIERGGVLEQRLESIEGPSPTLLVPITKEMMPNAFVGVHLLEDREAMKEKAHEVSDSYRFGYVELRLDQEKRRLNVSVDSDRKSYRPRDSVKLNIAVKDTNGRGRRSEVAVFVIDEGVLSLSGYEMPDPLATFLRPRPLRVETLESRESIARVFGFDPNLDENKGDPGGGGDGERSNLLTAAYFNPSLLTDEAGRATVEFSLPDNIGRFRVMAVAVSDDDYFGKGRGSVTVNQPLMIRPALPRFLRAGDRLKAAWALDGPELGNVDVEVTAELRGAHLLSPARQQVSLGPQGSYLVHYESKVDHVGEASFLLSAATEKHKDAVRTTVPVRTPAQLEAVALYGKTKTAEAHRLGVLDEVRDDMGELDVTMSSSALVGLKGGFEQLWDYPYSCSEQLASRALPLLALRDFAALYGIEAPQNADQRIADSIGQLIRRQRGDGGFGMWPESDESSPWVSAYALWVLDEARARGVHVPPSSFERGVRYLRDVASRRDDEHLTPAVFATFVLGRLDNADPQTLHSLAESIERMSVEAQILLAWAATSTEPGTPWSRALVQRVEGSITLRGNAAEITAPHGSQSGAIFSSDTRRHALALQALLADRPDHPLAAPLVRTILDARDGQGWESTQDSAFSLLALDAYRRAQETEEPRFEGLVFLGAKLLGQKKFSTRSTVAQNFAVEMKALVSGGDLIVQKKGSGTLFYEARLRYARKVLPQDALERGLSVRKKITMVSSDPDRPLGDASQETQKFERGALALVEIVVVAPTRRRYVVIDDPLPAGFEAIDPSLTTSQTSLSRLLSDSSDGYSHAWHRSELRDDRVLYFVDDMKAGVYNYRYLARVTNAGRFVTPPTRAMEMYQPEVYGRTAATTVEIAP